ncbi:SH3-like domain-containing protein [Burkholderia sp. PAMC 26561]|uniref:SH3-like domain-containing protein n=1 Tax=Burkholderia sp. PAMC 26561 TaxID=1795043 RepID=UPI0009EB969D|nr:SH3-like domain-containing protein [Burkholderia sp. PAMC 26561]
MTTPGFPHLSRAQGASSQQTLSRRSWLKALAASGAAVAMGYSAFASARALELPISGVVNRDGRVSPFKVGDQVAVSMRYPIGHYRTPFYLRGKQGLVVRVVDQHVNPEEEAFGRNAGSPLWVYQVRFSQRDLWPDYTGASEDHLQLETFENWLEKA